MIAGLTLGRMSKRMLRSRHLAASRHLGEHARASRPGSAVTNVEIACRPDAPVRRTVSATSSGVLNIRWFRPIASTPSSSATSTIW